MRALLLAILLIAQLDSRANGFPSANDACISDFTLVPTTSVGRETPQLDSRVSLLQPHGSAVGTATSGYYLYGWPPWIRTNGTVAVLVPWKTQQPTGSGFESLA